MRCSGVQGIANAAFLGWFLFSGLHTVAPYCVPAGIRMVSISPLYLRPAIVHVYFLPVQTRQNSPLAIDRCTCVSILHRLTSYREDAPFVPTPRATVRLQRPVRALSVYCQQHELSCRSRRRSKPRRRYQPAQGA
jgi:hypothetical protein